MNILALNWQDLKNPLSGGAEVHLEELLRRLVVMGHTVTLFCSNYDGGSREDEVEGVRIIRRGNRFNFNLIAPYHLRKLVRSENYDLLLEDINKIPFYTPLYLKIPTMVIIPHLFSTTVFSEINFVLGSYIYLAELPLTTVYRKKKFCVISESTASDMIGRGMPTENVRVIHCGIDAELYNNKKQYEKYDHPSLLYLGRIKKYKSIQHLISAFAIIRNDLPEIRLTIVGSGDFTESLKQQSSQLGLSDVIEFPGFVSVKEKVKRLCRSHVTVYPSLKEGWGLTNIEANSCGTAVVAANTPGLRDSVKDNHSGLLYEYGNIDQLVSKLKLLLTDDKKRQELEEGGISWAAQFSWDRAGEQFAEYCDEVAGEV